MTADEILTMVNTHRARLHEGGVLTEGKQSECALPLIPWFMKTRDKALRLSCHLHRLEDFVVVHSIDAQYGHMGATIADAILQAGTSYDAVVRPRVNAIKKNPETVTTSGFFRLIDKGGLKRVLCWSDDEKPNRVVGLTRFFLNEGIETERDLAQWLSVETNIPRLLGLRGVGPKTVDYLKILVGIQTVAVDRYVFRLLKEASVHAADYEEAKEILNLAADIMGVGRALFDHSVWQYMSKRERRHPNCTPGQRRSDT